MLIVTTMLLWVGLDSVSAADAPPIFSSSISYQYPEAALFSPTVSYWFYEGGGTSSNEPIVGPVISYLFPEWPQNLPQETKQSALVSFFFQTSTDTGPPTFILSGQVTQNGGGPLQGASLSVSVAAVEMKQSQTAIDGTYGFTPLAGGTYTIQASRAGYATSARVVNLNEGTAQQNFQLNALPPAPSTTPSTLQPAPSLTPPSQESLGSALMVFDGTDFVPITINNPLSQNVMTVVTTHGWISPYFNGTQGLEDWPKAISALLVANGVTPNMANIVAWDWRNAASGPLPPEENTPGQGKLLGQFLQATLGPKYSQPIHFLGHSLGALVNAAAVNYLHGDITAQEDVSPTPWPELPVHLTLFDEAELASFANGQAFFDGITVSDLSGSAEAGVFVYGAEVLQGWKNPIPVHFTWADNYVSLVGIYNERTVNASLEKGGGLLNPFVAHGYPMTWYEMTMADPTDIQDPLGFQNSYEYSTLPNLRTANFPPPVARIPLGVVYKQSPNNNDPLALEIDWTGELIESVSTYFGQAAQAVVQSVANGTVQIAGDVTVDIEQTAQSASQIAATGFNFVANKASQTGQGVANLYDSAVMKINLTSWTDYLPSPNAESARHSQDNTNPVSAVTNVPPMAWLPLFIPTNAVVMAFDFIASGPPAQDSLVCGIGETNLFSLQVQYIPTNSISASRLIDISAWSGQQVNLFFGLMGGTSTNCTLQIDNIRFFSLSAPSLSVTQSNGVISVSWPDAANGFQLESATNLIFNSWTTVSNTPAIISGQFVVTNSWVDPIRFFRLRQY